MQSSHQNTIHFVLLQMISMREATHFKIIIIYFLVKEKNKKC